MCFFCAVFAVYNVNLIYSGKDAIDNGTMFLDADVKFLTHFVSLPRNNFEYFNQQLTDIFMCAARWFLLLVMSF